MLRPNLVLTCLIVFLAKFACADIKLIVAKDGSGNYKTVQAAINAVPDDPAQHTVIFIKPGVYKEKITVPERKNNIKLLGEDPFKTILTYDDYASKKDRTGNNIGTSGSASFLVYGEGFSAENITFENSAGPVGQAVAMRVTGDKAHFKNCRFLGFQDTLYTHGDSSRQYYDHCYIEGTTDFIFGAATALFKDCQIYCKTGGQFITAASTPQSSKFGYVFLNCKISGDKGVSYFLGRPWRPYASVVFINCNLPALIKPTGWDFWGKEANKQTVRYAEYKNFGEGFIPNSRVNWSKQLTDAEAEEFTASNILTGWLP
ncbi:pectin esterase [Pelobium manganitolerans]|uniref:Pectinesterase n=1 Tax=Pelobium manganitolerans TaxID=1842495 RepID=A0A419S7E7_9SPHI|nr:pectinesterase family protein [Pelobium manganitolerans]RKD17159.1 pectin esterase [Pelobium manganitolerans]